MLCKIAQVLLPKDYIRWKLSGTYATDRAGAGGTLLLDLSTRTWAVDLLRDLKISEAWLPPTHEGTKATGIVDRTGALETGLLEGTPVYAGGGDQAAQAVGVGAIHPDTWAVTLGTSGLSLLRRRIHAPNHSDVLMRFHMQFLKPGI